ncbi:MAG TPA: hypothetical protein ENF33_03595 [Nitrososphaeria archaeon]|nr:hypothetical protein [Nitrososphaeria archaeon]
MKQGIDPEIAIMESYVLGETGETWRAVEELGSFTRLKISLGKSPICIMTQGTADPTTRRPAEDI